MNLGRCESDRASRGACNAMTVTVVIGIVTAVLFECFLEPLCRLFGATDGVLPYAMPMDGSLYWVFRSPPLTVPLAT